MFIRTLKYMMVGRTTVPSGKTVKVNAVEGKELVAKGYAVEVDELDKEEADVDDVKAKADADAKTKAEEEAKAKADADAKTKAEESKVEAETVTTKKTATKK